MNYPAIKHGDKVSCTMDGKGYTNIKVNVLDTGRIDLCFDGGNRYIGYQDQPRLLGSMVNNFRIHERADGTPVFMEGDIVIDSSGNKCKVLAVNNDSFLASINTNHNWIGYWCTFKESQADGYRLYKEEPVVEVVEMTVAEVSKLRGKTVKIVENEN